MDDFFGTLLVEFGPLIFGGIGVWMLVTYFTSEPERGNPFFLIIGIILCALTFSAIG